MPCHSGSGGRSLAASPRSGLAGTMLRRKVSSMVPLRQKPCICWSPRLSAQSRICGVQSGEFLGHACTPLRSPSRSYNPLFILPASPGCIAAGQRSHRACGPGGGLGRGNRTLGPTSALGAATVAFLRPAPLIQSHRGGLRLNEGSSASLVRNSPCEETSPVCTPIPLPLPRREQLKGEARARKRHLLGVSGWGAMPRNMNGL